MNASTNPNTSIQCVPAKIPHLHTIEKDTNRITVIIKTKEI